MNNGLPRIYAIAGHLSRETDAAYECTYAVWNVVALDRKDAERQASDRFVADYPESTGWKLDGVSVQELAREAILACADAVRAPGGESR